MMTLVAVEREVHRVFGPATVEADVDDSSTVRVLVEGWPDRVVYRTEALLRVLAGFGDGKGETEEGDREICTALDEAEAFVSFT